MRRSPSSIFKRLLAGLALATVGLVIAAPADAASVSFKVGDAKAATGQIVKIPITIDGAPGSPGMGALQFALVYDPKVLEAQEVVGGTLAPSALVQTKATTAGRLGLSFATSENVTGTGEVLVAQFKVIGSKGAKSSLQIDSAKAWQGDLDLFDIKVASKPGTFTVAGDAFPWWIIAVAVAALLVLLLIVRQFRKRRRGAVAPPLAPA
jgi:hypothetical protein